MRRFTRIVPTLTVAILMAASAFAEEERYLIMNIGDSGDHYIVDAATFLGGALDGVKPDAIDGSAKSYYIRMEEGATINSLDGMTRRVGEREPETSAPMSMTMAGEAAMPDPVQETGCFDLEASVASVYYWSPTGEGESDWRQEKPTLVICRLDDDTIVVFMARKGLRPEGLPTG